MPRQLHASYYYYPLLLQCRMQNTFKSIEKSSTIFRPFIRFSQPIVFYDSTSAAALATSLVIYSLKHESIVPILWANNDSARCLVYDSITKRAGCCIAWYLQLVQSMQQLRIHRAKPTDLKSINQSLSLALHIVESPQKPKFCILTFSALLSPSFLLKVFWVDCWMDAKWWVLDNPLGISLTT